jgi:hypothetical protein
LDCPTQICRCAPWPTQPTLPDAHEGGTTSTGSAISSPREHARRDRPEAAESVPMTPKRARAVRRGERVSGSRSCRVPAPKKAWGSNYQGGLSTWQPAALALYGTGRELSYALGTARGSLWVFTGDRSCRDC